jgi:hypothetical protein
VTPFRVESRPPEDDHVLAEAPEGAEFREGVNVWLLDDEGRFALPRFGVEAIGARWNRRGVQATVAFPDGRVLVGDAEGEARGPLDDHARPRVFGAGPVEFRCLEPFAVWTLTYEGAAVQTTVTEQLAGQSGHRHVDVSLDAELTMAAAPWARGQMSDGHRRALAGAEEELFIGAVGGLNCKQLFRATGTLRVAGRNLPFTATGVRVHRKGVRRTGNLRGHCWQSALFPSGRAFEALSFPDRSEGRTSYTEGFVIDGDRLRPAQVVGSPWMTEFAPHGADVSLVLRTAEGDTAITGRTQATSVMPGNDARRHVPIMRGGGSTHDLFFHQGSALYTWDGEQAIGMVERSWPRNRVTVHSGASCRSEWQ